MAIEVTTFNYPTAPNNNLDEVYDWLVANAAEFFPGGIVKNASRVYIEVFPIEGDNTTRMIIPFATTGNSSAGGIKTKYGMSTYQINPNATSYQSNAYRKAVKTSCGFVLMANSNGATWFVTKTENGNVCTYCLGSKEYGYKTISYIFCDLENDVVPSISGTSYSSVAELVSALRPWSGRQFTTLLPIVFTGGTYTTNMLMTPFTQANFSGDLQTVLIDGQEYIYDGFIALKS